MRTLLVDNHDSYTYNLYQLIAEIVGEAPIVIDNDQMSWEEAAALEPDAVVLSPGPGRPDRARDFGLCARLIAEAELPVLGVCLGHQGIAHVFGGRIAPAAEIVHGRLSRIHHAGDELFSGLPRSLAVVRYHSLAVAPPLPDCLRAIAWTDDGVVMALRHRERPLWGVQFHPESIASEGGHRILCNFVELAGRQRAVRAGSNGAGAARPARADRVEPASRPHRGSRRLSVMWRKVGAVDAERAFVSLYADHPAAFWLDSSALCAGARFSFLGDASGPLSYRLAYDVIRRELTIDRRGERLRRPGRLLDFVQAELAACAVSSPDLPFDFNAGFVGYVGYEVKADCGGRPGPASQLPDAQLVFADRLIAIDHLEQAAYLVAAVEPDGRAAAESWFDATERALASPMPPSSPGSRPGVPRFELRRSPDQYRRDIAECMRKIAEGESYEICLTNQFIADRPGDPLALYRALRAINPAPCAAFLRYGELAVASSSMERFLAVDREGWVRAEPIKGTRRRGRSRQDDAALRAELAASVKDRSEHLMIVDLLRNDLGRVCEIGSVSVPRMMQVETFPAVHQMVSTVAGKLRSDRDAVDCVRAAFPGGSMTGAPKKRTMEIIDDLEGEARGVYSGAIGYFGLGGGADLNIVIRTAVLTPGQISIGTGGAVVAMSDPEEELAEIELKAQPLIRAAEIAGAAGVAAEGECSGRTAAG